MNELFWRTRVHDNNHRAHVYKERASLQQAYTAAVGRRLALCRSVGQRSRLVPLRRHRRHGNEQINKRIAPARPAAGGCVRD